MRAPYASAGALPRSSSMLPEGTTASGPELLIELRRERGRPLRAQLEDGLRDAIRIGRLMAGAPLPSSRALARDLGVSRRLVVEAFAQLAAEGYLVTRRGAGTFVAETAAAAPAPTPAPQPRPPRYDFFPGAPDLSAFPRAAWARAARGGSPSRTRACRCTSRCSRGAAPTWCRWPSTRRGCGSTRSSEPAPR